jgi:uroporphyrinogen-III synthase
MVANSNGGKGAVLVTRPAGEASDSLCAAVTALGYQAFSQPLLELHSLSEMSPVQRQIMLDLDRYQHVIFISTNAVRFGLEQIENYWPQLPVGLNWYAIGAATSALLKRFGISAITPGNPMHSEALLATAQLQDVRDQRVLIVKGEGGREVLQQELSRRGANVDVLACYCRRLPELPAGELADSIVQRRINTVLISSGEGLANFQVLLRPAETTKFRHLRIIVPSDRVARMARVAGFDQIVTAENASDAAMLHALEKWQPNSGE